LTICKSLTVRLCPSPRVVLTPFLGCRISRILLQGINPYNLCPRSVHMSTTLRRPKMGLHPPHPILCTRKMGTIS
jgi:hypothetical protein